MFLERKELVEGRKLPRGYRFAYWDVCRQRGVAYPIGLHLIPRLIRRIWEWSLAYRPSVLERLLTEARTVAVAEYKAKTQKWLHMDGPSEYTQGPIDPDVFGPGSEEWQAAAGECLKKIAESKEMKWNQP